MLTLNLKAFNELQKTLKLNNTQMAELLGIERTQLWRVKSKKSSPGTKFISSFKSTFPDKNTDDFFIVKVLRKRDTKKQNHIT